MLRDAAISWIRANCPDPKLRADFERQLDDALHDGVDCWFVIGKEMTRKRIPELVHCFAGELFIFQLTDAQVASLGTRPNGLGYSRDPHPLSHAPLSHPIVHVSNVELDQPNLTAEREITGWCDYAIPGQAPAAICLRLDYSLGKLGNLISWNYPEQVLSSACRFRLQFAPLAAAAPPRTRAYKGPAMMFLRVCTLPASGDAAARQVISNACGTLADFI